MNGTKFGDALGDNNDNKMRKTYMPFFFVFWLILNMGNMTQTHNFKDMHMKDLLLEQLHL